PTSVCMTTTSVPSLLPLLIQPPATSIIYTLSLHDALPIFIGVFVSAFAIGGTLFLMHTSPTFGPIGSDKLPAPQGTLMATLIQGDRKSTRLNSSHVSISYAGFRLKNKRRRRALSAGAEQPQ